MPAPLPPDDPEAWYAPDVQAQYEVHPGVVVHTENYAPAETDLPTEPATSRDSLASASGVAPPLVSMDDVDADYATCGTVPNQPCRPATEK